MNGGLNVKYKSSGMVPLTPVPLRKPSLKKPKTNCDPALVKPEIKQKSISCQQKTTFLKKKKSWIIWDNV